MSNEFTEYQCLLENMENEALKKRAELSLKYYIKKAVLYKRLWNILSAIGIVLPAIATFLACVKVDAWALALVTLITTAASGLLALFKCGDKKTSYRNSAENLKSELCAYASRSGAYSGEVAQRDGLLFEQMERIIKEGYDKIAALEKNQAAAKQ